MRQNALYCVLSHLTRKKLLWRRSFLCLLSRLPLSPACLPFHLFSLLAQLTLHIMEHLCLTREYTRYTGLLLIEWIVAIEPIFSLSGTITTEGSSVLQTAGRYLRTSITWIGYALETIVDISGILITTSSLTRPTWRTTLAIDIMAECMTLHT